MNKYTADSLVCPGCTATIVTERTMGGPAGAGAVGVCGKCHAVFHVDASLTAHVLTREEAVALPRRLQEAIEGARSVTRKLEDGTLTEEGIAGLSANEASVLLAAQLSESADLARRIMRLLQAADILPTPITGLACLQVSAILAISANESVGPLRKDGWRMIGDLVYDLAEKEHRVREEGAPDGKN